MKTKLIALFLMLLAIGAVLAILATVVDLFQYRNSARITGTITEVLTNRLVKIAYNDGQMDIVADVSYRRGWRPFLANTGRKGWLRGATVGTKVPIVYVPGYSGRTRLSEAHWDGSLEVMLRFTTLFFVVAWACWCGALVDNDLRDRWLGWLKRK